MLALDPPDDGATIGGVVATGDSGPLRHRYGGPRDLVLGVQVALPDGSLARAGSKVIKNVAGYDLAKLMTGAYGTLGVVDGGQRAPAPHAARAADRRRAPRRPARAGGRRARARRTARSRPSASTCAGRASAGAVLVQLCGAVGAPSARRAIDGEVVEDDEELWAAQRAAQRGPVVLRVSTTQQGLDDVLARRARPRRDLRRARRPRPRLAALRGRRRRSWSTALRARLGACVLLDAPAALRREVDPWGTLSAEPLMRRVKARFDPYDTLNPGLLRPTCD